MVTDAGGLLISSAAATAYLSTHGWHLTERYTAGSVWTRRLDDENEHRLYVPQDRDPYNNYGQRLARVVSAVAVEEGRSELAVLAELLSATETSKRIQGPVSADNPQQPIVLSAWYENTAFTTAGDLVDYLQQFPPVTQVVLTDDGREALGAAWAPTSAAEAQPEGPEAALDDGTRMGLAPGLDEVGR